MDLAARVSELEERVRQLERSGVAFRAAVDRLGQVLGCTRDRPAMMQAVVEAAVDYLDAERGVFYVAVSGTDRLRSTTSYPDTSGGTGGPVIELGPGEGLAGAAVVGDEPVVWPGPERPGRAGGAGGPSVSPAEPASGVTTAMAVPVRSGTQRFGVLALYGRTMPQPFTVDDTVGLSTLVHQAETAIENTFLYEEAVRLSLTDGLTGLWNRRQFDLRLSSELSRAIRFEEPFSVVLADLDQLKQVNDDHGHPAGDAVLVELAARFAGNVREVDLVARFGGDEFGLLLPKTGLAGALRLADKVRQAADATPFMVEEKSLAVTISVGVATYPEHGRSRTALVAAADAALSRAKLMGRNRVEHAKVTAGVAAAPSPPLSPGPPALTGRSGPGAP